MHKAFTSLNELFEHINEDKEWHGANSGQHNRYPIRFVLFDNFADFNEFIVERPGSIYKYSLDDLLDSEYPDTFASYTELGTEIRSLVKRLPANDFVVFPFSEMTRFYTPKEFESLVKTIRLTEPPSDSQDEHIRMYIPIVGMQGKMSPFIADHQTFVWEYKSNAEKGQYNLIITNGTTYGVHGLNEKYSVVNNLTEWLKLWKDGDKVKRNIISSSKTIFANAQNAQPDNAFTYVECRNAYDFLTKGLKIDFGTENNPSYEELAYWELLAKEIDVESFDFNTFINERFDTFNIHNSLDFIKTWIECDNGFDRWLLTLYFKKISSGGEYIIRALEQCANLSTSELFSNIATAIFDIPMSSIAIEERRKAMQLAASKKVKLTEVAEQRLEAKLKAIVANPEQGVYTALQLLTTLTESERRLIIQWIGEGRILPNDIRRIYPDLYHYLSPMSLLHVGHNKQWINQYFEAYRTSKIRNGINETVAEMIGIYNATPASFVGWRDNFKTVRTILHNREDIDVYYWIDGLGVDWIPFITHVIGEYAKENVFLNEVHVAVSSIPTTTSNNKPALQSLLPDGEELSKIGSLDSFAHQHKSYPQYIIDELQIVREAIHKVLDQYNGKKIAFVSDHGVSYLAQYPKGLKLAGLSSDHEGRLAYTSGKIVSDNKYIILDDNKTICSLTHASLTDKVSAGHGAHGGCTPEEVLVPIIIVSSHKNASNYTVKIVSDEISGTNPVVEFIIKGLNSIDIPVLEYNGVTYTLENIGNDTYRSERLNLVDTASKVIVRIADSFKSSFNIHVSTG
ncbi:MAG: BREX-4 system phosphatase PglZ, partial [Muribaculum sp.]|nr:BREX-4 system phosphatase PglZ [Muribaculum sp.]